MVHTATSRVETGQRIANGAASTGSLTERSRASEFCCRHTDPGILLAPTEFILNSAMLPVSQMVERITKRKVFGCKSSCPN